MHYTVHDLCGTFDVLDALVVGVLICLRRPILCTHTCVCVCVCTDIMYVQKHSSFEHSVRIFLSLSCPLWLFRRTATEFLHMPHVSLHDAVCSTSQVLQPGSRGVSFANFVTGTIFFQSLEGGRYLLSKQEYLLPEGIASVSATLREMIMSSGDPESDPMHLCTLVSSRPFTAAIDAIKGVDRLAVGLDEASMALVLHQHLGLLDASKGSTHDSAHKNTSWRGDRFTVSLFVCGTYEDFAAERERMQRCVLPAISRLLHSRGLSINMLDLRRSIHPNDDTDGSRVSILLSHLAMQQCAVEGRTFVLGLLGEQQGWAAHDWQPPQAYPSAAHANVGPDLQWVCTPPHSEGSITAIELHAACLRNPSRSTGLLCIRSQQLSLSVNGGDGASQTSAPLEAKRNQQPVFKANEGMHRNVQSMMSQGSSRSLKPETQSKDEEQETSPISKEDERRERVKARLAALKDATRHIYTGHAAKKPDLLDEYSSLSSFTNCTIRSLYGILDEKLPSAHTNDHRVLLSELIKRQEAYLASTAASFVNLGPRPCNVLNKILEYEAQCAQNPCIMVITGPSGSGRTINVAEYARDRVARARPCFYYIGTGVQEDSELIYEALTLQLLAFVGQPYPQFIAGRDVVRKFAEALQVTQQLLRHVHCMCAHLWKYCTAACIVLV
jgi:hypothetical protein